MKLSYRGVSYERTPSTLDVNEGDIGGTYRGQGWRYHYVRHIPAPPPVHELKWRGVAYRTDKPAIAEPIPAPQPVDPGAANPVLVISNWRGKNLDETAVMHLRNIRQSLERRLQVAQAKGDEQLVRMLEKESEQTAVH
ncbi:MULTISPECIES: DUF4278 domain-containing protein [unclassified Coleofasciculus]|uniref:arginine synthesis PII-interacting regulator PirA n=1 Tax=unclassified Coleofasciculus TaxID=2692782 RepID=UPI00187E3F72|nr:MULTISPECIES: DUF4278 domain-containing protein [unclassified Coleofasciculus]MBE9124837.1 DUF4278 domain-containing protein [Coleofasciculus sp. LEGE 07081]MBE9147742.1 DUF4278 domain-containing protein [Coleofasciculus sp. LEGE 07092]